MFETRWLVRLGRLSGEDLDFSSFRISLDAKLAVSGRMELVTDVATYTKRSMRPNNLSMQFPFLSIY